MKLPVTIRVPEIACWSTLYMHLQYIVDSFEDISQQIYSLRSMVMETLNVALPLASPCKIKKPRDSLSDFRPADPEHRSGKHGLLFIGFGLAGVFCEALKPCSTLHKVNNLDILGNRRRNRSRANPTPCI